MMDTVLVIAVVVIAIAATAGAGYLAILVDEGRKIAAALADEVDDAVMLLEAATKVLDARLLANVDDAALTAALDELEEAIAGEGRHGARSET